MNILWMLYVAGILFCFSGLYFFHRRVHEPGRRLTWPFVIMIMGVILIGIGTAYDVKLLH